MSASLFVEAFHHQKCDVAVCRPERSPLLRTVDNYWITAANDFFVRADEFKKHHADFDVVKRPGSLDIHAYLSSFKAFAAAAGDHPIYRAIEERRADLSTTLGAEHYPFLIRFINPAALQGDDVYAGGVWHRDLLPNPAILETLFCEHKDAPTTEYLDPTQKRASLLDIIRKKDVYSDAEISKMKVLHCPVYEGDVMWVGPRLIHRGVAAGGRRLLVSYIKSTA